MSRKFRSIAFAFAMLTLVGTYASAQAVNPAQKDVTDGFFDMPVKDDPDGGKGNAVPGYLITSLLSGVALYALCKSSRRGA